MECSFCGVDIESGTETLYVTKKGKPYYFCSSKCEKNLLKLGRKPRKVKWTKTYREEKTIRLRGVSAKEEKKETAKEEKKETAKEEKKETAKEEKKETAKEEKKYTAKTNRKKGAKRETGKRK